MAEQCADRAQRRGGKARLKEGSLAAAEFGVAAGTGEHHSVLATCRCAGLVSQAGKPRFKAIRIARSTVSQDGVKARVNMCAARLGMFQRFEHQKRARCSQVHAAGGSVA